MAKETQEVMVGVGTLYVGPEEEPEPGDDAAIAGNWLSPGYTDEGLNFSFEREGQEHFVEEEPDPVIVLTNRTNFTVQVSLAQDSLENLKTAYGGGEITTTAAGTGQIGKKTYRFSDTHRVIALLVEGDNPLGFYRRVYIPRVMAVGTVETPWRRADGKRVYPCSFRAMANGPNAERTITDKTDEAL